MRRAHLTVLVTVQTIKNRTKKYSTMYGMVTSHSSVKGRSAGPRRQPTVSNDPPPSPEPHSTSGRFFRLVRQAWSGVKLALDTDVDEDEIGITRRAPRGLDSLCRATRFSKRELQLLYRGFKQDCPTGLVSEDALRIIYARFFPQGADASKYVHYVFKTFDKEKNGEISFEELVIGLSGLLRGSPQERLSWAFRLYDLDDDGKITRHELLHVVVAVHGLMGRCTTAQREMVLNQVERVFQKLDVNQDGVVTIDEFIGFCLQDEGIAKSMDSLDAIW